MKKQLEKAITYSRQISLLVKTNCVVLDLESKKTIGNMFSERCSFCRESSCKYMDVHFYGGNEAERWNGQYMYYCPRGLFFLANTVYNSVSKGQYCFITGPFVLGARNQTEIMIKGGIDDLENIPSVTSEEAQATNEIISTICRFLSESTINEMQGDTTDILNTSYNFYQGAENIADLKYPMDIEKRLQRYIIEGNKEESIRVLNELLCHITLQEGNNIESVKMWVIEILVLLSRASIEGGADSNRILWLNKVYLAQVEAFQNIESISKWLSSIINKFISYEFELSSIKHKDALYKISEYLNEHYQEKIVLDDLVEKIFLSRTYLSKIIKEELGISFVDYLNQIRIEKSKALLTNSNLSLTDIAVSVGFQEQSYFTKVFKKIVGVPPGKYRNIKQV